MQLVLDGAGFDADHQHGAVPASGTLLGRIQDDVRADRAPPGAPFPGEPDTRAPLGAEDRSIEIHSCHGRVRQVEVIRDAILHALADDESLEPRDVIVMCPDIETFAPLVQATFGAGERPGDQDGDEDRGELIPDHQRPIDLRVRLADRSLRQTNPVLGVASQLLELAEQRLTASQVLDLADREPVRRRFQFDDDDLTRMQDWIAQAGIRWGLDAAHRAPFKLELVPSGTWRAGLDRLLLGATMTEDGQRLFADVLPLDDVDSRSIDLAGRVAELIERLGSAIDALSEPKTLAAWAQAIGDAADSLTDSGPRARWQRAELQRVLDELVDEAAARADGSNAYQLAPSELRAHLAERLQGRPTRANFCTGHLTVCTLMPMRSVPHRVVCLLGLDDGAFPRKGLRDGDDLMLEDPHVGERDPRSEDRQLMLDALLAATERLIITYSGNDERTNTLLAPAVPVGELLDVIDATARCDDGPAHAQVVVRQPLQPFDPRNFASSALVRGRTWSFDPVALEGARALTGPRSGPPPFLAAPLPPRPVRVVELDDLVRFVEHPVRAFLRQRLGISLRGGADEIEDAMLVELDGLKRWGVGQRLLDARLGGIDGNVAIKAEIARGTLPPGVLGEPVIRAVYPIVDAIVAETTRILPEPSDTDPLEVRVRLDDGRVLSGTVGGLRGDVLLNATYSRVGAKHRLAAWVRLLALTASHPEHELSAATIGRAGSDDVRVALVAPLGATADARRASALEQLAVLIDLFDRGMREPLPLFCATSAAYAEAVRAGQEPIAAAERAWTTAYKFDGEDAEPEHQLAHGGVRTFAELVEVAPRADEAGVGWAELETSRAGRLADRMWGALLAREKLSAR
jgi:exodeoxyribonuclease V gamma subunit